MNGCDCRDLLRTPRQISTQAVAGCFGYNSGTRGRARIWVSSEIATHFATGTRGTGWDGTNSPERRTGKNPSKMGIDGTGRDGPIPHQQNSELLLPRRFQTLCSGRGLTAIAGLDQGQTALCASDHALTLSKGHISRLWRQRAFLKSVKTKTRPAKTHQPGGEPRPCVLPGLPMSPPKGRARPPTWPADDTRQHARAGRAPLRLSGLAAGFPRLCRSLVFVMLA